MTYQSGKEFADRYAETSVFHTCATEFNRAIQEHRQDEREKVVRECAEAYLDKCCNSHYSGAVYHAILSVAKPAAPVSPFGCKCWRHEPNDVWSHKHPITGHVTIAVHDQSHCQWCGSPRQGGCGVPKPEGK